MVTATIIGLGLLLALALIAPVISSEHVRTLSSRRRPSSRGAVQGGGKKDEDTPMPHLPAPPLPPDQV
jgi:hypothetical protein